MRRVLLFLLIFGAGFAVLWTLRTKAPDKGQADTSTPVRPGQFTEIEAPGAKKEGQRIAITAGGKLSFVQSRDVGGVRHPEIVVDSKNVVAVGENVYDMHDLEIQLFDPATQKKRADLRSPLSRVKIATQGGDISLSESEPVRLTNVDMTLYEGGPVVPLHLKVPALDWTIGATTAGAEKSGTDTFSSDDRVHIEGTGLEADGTGLLAKMSESSFELKRDAQIVLTLENGQQVTLVSGLTGAIVMRKALVGGVEHVDVTANEGARFTASGPEPVTIVAQTIHMLGRRPTADRSSPATGYEIVSADAAGDVDMRSRGDRFQAQKADLAFATAARLEKATLDGKVVLTGGPDTFRSDHAVFEFDVKDEAKKGELVKATLTGTPSGTIEIGRFLPPDRIEMRDARGVLSGQGPLVVTRRGGDRVDFTGPAKLAIPDVGLELTAQTSIEAHDERAEKKGTLTATGSSVLVYGNNRLASDSLDLRWATSEAGVTTVDATAHGASSVTGVTDLGAEFTIVAGGGLDARSVEDKVKITEARDVVITSPERGGTTAKAAVVRNIDLEARSFEAEGRVTFADVEGEGSGERIVSVSRDEVHLFGTIDAPAHYRFADPAQGVDAAIDALEIVLLPDHATAHGSVRSHVETPDSRLDLACTDLELDVAAADPAKPEAPRTFHAHASKDVQARWTTSSATNASRRDVLPPNQLRETKFDVACQDMIVDGVITPDPANPKRPAVKTTNVVGRTGVHVDYEGAGTLSGDGDLFTLDGEDKGRLSADPGKTVSARGRFVGTPVPYALVADWIEFDQEHVEAANVRVSLDEKSWPAGAAQSQSGLPPGPGASPALLGEMRAEKMRVDKGEVLLSGAAHIEGVTQQGEAWTVDAETIRLRGDFSDARTLRTDMLSLMQAQGGFRAKLGDRLEAEGATLDGTKERIRIEGTPAHLILLGADWQSPWIQYDMTNMLLSTDTGSMRSRVGSPGPSWSIEYESMQPFDQGDTTILALRNPRLRSGSRQLFAEWTLFWVDRNEWRKSGTRTISEAMQGTELRVGEPDEDPARARPVVAPRPRGNNPFNLPNTLFDIQANPILRVLSEVYIEGNIEIFDEAERKGRASAIYLDIVAMQGWIQDADVSIDIDIRGFKQRLSARAQWMRISPEPALRAEKAEITACDFDEPHYVVETSDLRIRPKTNVEDQRVAYDVSARGNSIRFENGIRMPLPPLVYETDEEGNPLVDRFVLGNSAKYGAAVQATVNAELGPIGEATGKAIAHILNFPDVDVRGNWHYKVGILGSRGILLGPGLELRAGDVFRMDMELDAIPDRGDDKGLVQVDQDDRSTLRTWFHSRARYTVDRDEWWDLAISTQSDAGVQSEFFERQYLTYEQKDTYLHWRRAADDWYFNGSVKYQIDNRRDVDELPAAGAYLGRTELGEAFGNPFYYTGQVDGGYFSRQDGDARYYQPWADGLGDREYWRVDTEHRLEEPFGLGVLNAHATPYVTARATAWSEGADQEEAPSRAALIAGVDLTTTLWKRFTSGSVHTITPTIGFRQDIASEEQGGDPVHIDLTDDPYTGRFVEAGLRTRWWVPDTLRHLDLDMRLSHGADLADGEESGLQPLAVVGNFLTYYKTIPIAMAHDGRYDLEDGNTVYSMTSLGFEPWTNLGIEFGYQRGLSTDQSLLLFESASIGIRYRMSAKWEIEAGQSFAIAGDTGVGYSVGLRRLGHDFVTEIGFGYREGEGSSFAIGFEPRIAYKRSGLGLLDQILGEYH